MFEGYNTHLLSFSHAASFCLLAYPAGFGKKQDGVSQLAFVYNSKPMCIRLSGTCPLFLWLVVLLGGKRNTRGSGNIWLPGRPLKRATAAAASGPDLRGGESGSRGCMCSVVPPALAPELTLSSVRLSWSLFCSVVATFSFAPFSSLEFAHWGPTHKTAALWEGGGCFFDVKTKVVWRD